jgi:hypothetical protein
MVVQIKRAGHYPNSILLVFIFLVTACSLQDDNIVGPDNISNGQVKIQVAQDGFYRLTLDKLEETGLSLETLNIENLHLSQAGTAVPYLLRNRLLLT